MNEQQHQQPFDSAKSEAMRRADVVNGESVVTESTTVAESTTRSQRILLAVDDSDTSVRAARSAHQIFGDDATYFAVNVGTSDVPLWGGDPMTWGVPYPLAMAGMAVEGAPARPAIDPNVPSAVDLAEAEARSVSTAASLPGNAIAVGVTGDPVEQIRQVADDESIDVIVVGSGSGGWWRHLFDPSVSKAIVRRADRPVLVVPVTSPSTSP